MLKILRTISRPLLTIMLIIGTPILANKTQVKSPLSAKQKQVIQEAYSIGKQIVAYDGMTFEYATAGVILTESSAGKNLIGDESPDLMLRKASIGSMQFQLATAKWVIKRDKLMNQYYSFLLKPKMEKRLISLLLSDVSFSAMMGATYLKMNYESKLRKGATSKQAYFYAISKYNGGSHNWAYYARVIKNIKNIKRWKTLV